MKILPDIQDSLAVHLVEVLKSVPYVKNTPLTEKKAQRMGEIKEVVDNLRLVKAGKLKARPVEELLNEL